MAIILVIDDEESIRFTFYRFLEAVGHQVIVADSYQTALARMDEAQFDLILADVVLGDGCGLNILDEVVRRGLKTGVIIMTAYPTKKSKDVSFQMHAMEYLIKPLRQDRLLAVVKHSLERLIRGPDGVWINGLIAAQ